MAIISAKNRELISRITGPDAAVSYNPMQHLSLSAFDRLIDAAREQGRKEATEAAS